MLQPLFAQSGYSKYMYHDDCAATSYTDASDKSLEKGPVQAGGLETFQIVPVTDVAKCLQAVDPQKAIGSDNPPGIILQRFAHILAPNLTKINNRSLTTGKVPDTFKISHVSPLFKSGDPSIPKNYRPVSLLPIISRILEVMVKRQVMAYLDNHHLMPVSQFCLSQKSFNRRCSGSGCKQVV